EIRLLLTLEPKRSGELEIPPMSFDGERTRRLTLRVDPAPEPEPGAPPAVFVEVEVSPENGPYYVHGQFGLTVRVFYQQNLTEAAISQPEPESASVRLLEETPYQAERAGEPYRVLERRYAVFPERSGAMRIPPLRLSGRLVERRAGNVWQPAVRGRRIDVQSDPLQLTVEPRPAAFSGAHWQPARDLQLSQQVTSADALRVGEPVTRTVIIDAVGLEENMIVEPPWPELENVRIYPDKPQGITRDDGEWVLGHKEFRYAVVPEQEGTLVLPELTVRWWDTQHHRERTAVLPAKSLQVSASNLVPAAADAGRPAATAFAEAAGAAHPGARQPDYWRGLTVLFATLWLASLLMLWRWRPAAQAPRAEQASGSAETEQALLGQLRHAAERGQAGATRLALLNWLRAFGPVDAECSLLTFASSVSDQGLRSAVEALDAAGFRPDTSGDWQGKDFWRRFECWRKDWRSRAGSQEPPLSDLYAPANRRR
ncbi:MAG: hypothetical protein RQ826_13130, partial [Xanthomonadales bacterium]|nr:hypothetical protein [Xanthomonadales bacterium]